MGLSSSIGLGLALSINKNVISMDDMFQGRGGLRPDVKIKKDLKFDPKWDNYRKDYMKLVKQDASIYKNPKFQNKKGKFLNNYFVTNGLSNRATRSWNCSVNCN